SSANDKTGVFDITLQYGVHCLGGNRPKPRCRSGVIILNHPLIPYPERRRRASCFKTPILPYFFFFSIHILLKRIGSDAENSRVNSIGFVMLIFPTGTSKNSSTYQF